MEASAEPGATEGEGQFTSGAPRAPADEAPTSKEPVPDLPISCFEVARPIELGSGVVQAAHQALPHAPFAIAAPDQRARVAGCRVEEVRDGVQQLRTMSEGVAWSDKKPD